MKSGKLDTKEVPLWTKNFLLTTFSNLFLFFSFQMLIPTLPVYTEKMGGDEFTIGLVIGIFTISALLVRPFAGKALDNFSRKKILLIGFMIFIVSVISYNWMTTVILILGLRFIHGIGWGITTTSYGTIISEIIPNKRRGEGMGYFGLSSTLAMALAPLIGLALINNYGFTHLFVISTLLAVTALIISQTIKYPPVQAKQDDAKSFWAGLFEVKALFPALLIFFLAFAYGGVVTFITLFGKEVNIENVGWFFMGNALMVMIVRPISGTIFDQKGHKWVLIPGITLSIVGLFLLSYTTNVTSLVISAMFFGAGFGSVQPALQAWTINRVPANRRGAANATFFSAFDLGIGLGAVILGLLARVTTYGMMYRLSIILFVLFIVSYLYYLLTGKDNNVDSTPSVVKE